MTIIGRSGATYLDGLVHHMASRSGAVTDPAAIRAGPGLGAFKPLDPNTFQFSLKNILTVLSEVRYEKLPLLAVQLDLEGDLSDIEAVRDPDQVRKRLAETWLQRCGHDANWGMLVSALRSQTVEEQAVASRLEIRFLRRDSGTSTLSSSGSEPYSPRSPISNVSNTTEEKGTQYIHVATWFGLSDTVTQNV